MSLRSTTVGGVITAARLPASTALSVLGRGRVGRKLQLAVERSDATARGAAGTILRDQALRDDAKRRHQAADERQRALDLRERADDLRADAGSEVRESRTAAERQRDEAEDRYEERQERIRQSARQTKQAASRVTETRKAVADRDAARKRQHAQERSDED